jgi:hypothetical protein
MKTLLKTIVCLLPVALLAGCASGYHCYPCGRVSCHYCPPAPLPSVVFNSCNCQDSKGQRYLGNTALETEQDFTTQIAENPGNQRIKTAKRGN